MEGRRLRSILGLCGIAAPVGFVLLVIVAGANYPGYSHVTQAISELGGVDAPNPSIQNVNFAIFGVLLLAFAMGLHLDLRSAKGSTPGVALVAAFGLVSAAHAALPCDVGCEFVSPMGAAHNVTGLMGFLSILGGIFLISRAFARDPKWKRYRAFSVGTAVIGLVSLVLWIALAKAARLEMLNGSLQRVFIGTVLLWVGVVGSRLFALSRMAGDAHAGEVLDARSGM